MPDWTYHTFLRPLMPRVPRRVLRAWGRSKLGGRVIAFVADAPPPDPRLGALASEDTAGIASRLGVGFTRTEGRATGDPGEAARQVAESGHALLDLGVGGPGLPKRVHEATTPAVRGPLAWGFLLLGVGMVVAGAVAGVVALTRVVLPYDESYVAIPPDLLPFLAHDRMTLAGTMVSIGVLYAALALFARGAPWARRAIAISAVAGFANFFLFLAFGYFDPLHAAISAGLFPLFLWGVLRGGGGSAHAGVPDLANDAAWRRAQWGILGFVALGFGLVVGGLTIATIGSTSVFVPSDRAFIGPIAMSPRLVSLVAHDRAGFGGALVSEGLLVVFATMWGARRGAAWLWWALLAAGLVGFGATLAVHFAVGYTDAGHLAPVVFAFALFGASLGALREYLCPTSPRTASLSA